LGEEYGGNPFGFLPQDEEVGERERRICKKIAAAEDLPEGECECVCVSQVSLFSYMCKYTCCIVYMWLFSL
jgi:hypothetical protein